MCIHVHNCVLVTNTCTLHYTILTCTSDVHVHITLYGCIVRLTGYRHRAQSIIQWKSLDQLEKEAVKGLYENIDYRRGSSYRIMLCEVVYGNDTYMYVYV